MIRLSMLQFRIQAITAAVTLAAFTILLAATGPHLASMYAADGLDSCHGSSCLSMATYFTASLARSPYDVVFLLSTGIILLAPAVIGLFWGAPLIARELETGTADAGLEPVRHPDPVAGRQARHRRPDRDGRHRGAVPHADLVGSADQPGRRRRLRQPVSPRAGSAS